MICFRPGFGYGFNMSIMSWAYELNKTLEFISTTGIWLKICPQ